MNDNDQILDKPVPAKWYITLVLGILLILGSLISLMTAYNQYQDPIAVDFFFRPPNSCPPFSSGIQPNTRIAYCISVIENMSTSDYVIDQQPTIVYDSTERDKVTVEGITIRRQGQALFINNQPLEFGQSYSGVQRNFFNPWLMISTQVDCYGSVSSSRDIFYVTCNAKKFPRLSPFGVIILFAGFGLITLGNWGIDRTKIAREQPAMEPPVPLKTKARDIALGFFGWALLDNVYFLLLYSMLGEMAANPFILWVPTIIAIPVLYAQKRSDIGAGAALAVITNVGIWTFIIRDFMSPFINLLIVSGLPLPSGLLLLW